MERMRRGEERIIKRERGTILGGCCLEEN